MTQYGVQPRSSGIWLGGANWLAQRLVRMFARRPRRLPLDRLTDHLLRDAGLERTCGRIGQRLR